MRRRVASRFNLTVTVPADIDWLSLEALKALVVQLLSKVAEQERLIADLREEIARLKGLNGRPRIKPSGMENASAPKRPGEAGQASASREDRATGRRRGSGDQGAVPPGSRFKGYESFVVQDIVLRAEAIRYRRERWVTPAGATCWRRCLPASVGHFGPELRRFVLAQYHQGQVTVQRLVAQLRAIGISHLQATDDAPADRPARMGSWPKAVTCCGQACRRPPGSRWTTPARVTRAGTASARRSAMTNSPGSARGRARAG